MCDKSTRLRQLAVLFVLAFFCGLLSTAKANEPGINPPLEDGQKNKGNNEGNSGDSPKKDKGSPEPNISPEDLSGDYLPNRVLKFQKAHYHYTMVPLKEMAYEEQQQAFRAAQIQGYKYLKNWHLSVADILGDEQYKKTIKEASTDELRNLLQKGQGQSMPSDLEIAKSVKLSSEDVNKKRKQRNKTIIELKTLTKAYNQGKAPLVDKLKENNKDPGFVHELKNPDAYVISLGYKLPDALAQKLAQYKFTRFLAALSKASISATYAMRPWKVKRLNLNTGKEVTYRHWESALSGWGFKDIKSKTSGVSQANLRINAGAVWALQQNFNSTRDISGSLLGVSWNTKATALGLEKLPKLDALRLNVKTGIIGPGFTDVFTEGKATPKFVYAMIGPQMGINRKSGPASSNTMVPAGNAGYVVDLQGVGDLFADDEIDFLFRKAMRQADQSLNSNKNPAQTFIFLER